MNFRWKNSFLNVDVISLICSPQMMGDDTWPGFITCFQYMGIFYKLYFCKLRISDLKDQSSHFELQLQCKNTVAISELAHRRTWSVPGYILIQFLDKLDMTTYRQHWGNLETYLGQPGMCLFYKHKYKYKYKYKVTQTRTWSVSVLHFPVLPPSSKTAVEVV